MADFSNWLIAEMDRRGMTQADLARSGSLSTSTISMLLSGARSLGADSALGIARALKIAPENVYRAAGMLPPKPKEQAELDDIVFKFTLMGQSRRAEVIDYIDFLLARDGIMAETQQDDKPLTEGDLVRAIRLMAVKYNLRLEEMDLAALLRSSQKENKS